MSQTTNSSVFAEIESAAPIEVFQLISTYNEDTFPQKVNLGVGVCDQEVRPRQQALECESDFEQGSWLAIKSLFPNAVVKGCAFHWGQSIWRHVQSIGLQVQYRQHDGVYKYIRKLMALCFLPHEHILPAFQHLQDQINPEESPKLHELTTYILKTWMTSTVWPIESWSVFMRPTRTNNDVEGWHNRLNTSRKTGSGDKGLYTLAPLLHEESDRFPLNAQFISKGKLKKIQKKQTRTMQRSIFDNWGKYINADMSVSRLLRLSARLVYVPDS